MAGIFLITPFTQAEYDRFQDTPVDVVAEKALGEVMRVVNWSLKNSEVEAKDYKSAIIKKLAEGLPE